jgi:DNA-binding transcriptional regulator YiaG
MERTGYSVRSFAIALSGHEKPLSTNTVQAWRSGRQRIPPYLWRALKHLEQHPEL